jgi:hypothetical protein
MMIEVEIETRAPHGTVWSRASFDGTEQELAASLMEWGIELEKTPPGKPLERVFIIMEDGRAQQL